MVIGEIGNSCPGYQGITCRPWEGRNDGNGHGSRGELASMAG
ncbi:hypothetical protein FHS42_003970 [Streptomyces zagrosensis]|uniref:Uncharacterized protein n=1 Tax=Streptomyces zagrosensis TaxID=1042984 RepID=A0A7W9QAX0_9ACTN|nr:hypothetical protein [Streptomyces zagrosensis]